MSPNAITTQTLVVAVKTITLLLGGLITYFAFRAYRRTRARSLGALALGFAFVTVGSILAGAADLILGTPLAVGLLIESALFAVGFAVIVYSLYMTEA